MNDDGYLDYTCEVCGYGFTEDEWDNRHDLHALGCNHRGCDCDMPIHAYCCPICNKPRRKKSKEVMTQ